jgi:hypothetical protein
MYILLEIPHRFLSHKTISLTNKTFEQIDRPTDRDLGWLFSRGSLIGVEGKRAGVKGTCDPITWIVGDLFCRTNEEDNLTRAI